MNLPRPEAQYDYANEAQSRAEIGREDSRNQKRGQDYNLGPNLAVIVSPDGTRYRIVVSNAGVLSTVAA
jgi:hypothetical protein